MSGSTQKPEWRSFEELVALVERHLAPKGAIVRSPDRIPDKTTGQLREVDASVRYQVGSIPVLITIECRDRTSREDVTWIEQLISKRDSVGASVTVAVSSTGFSLPAIEKARSRGIEIRLLREVSEDAVREWAQKLEVVAVHGQFGMGRLRLQLKATADNPKPELHPRLREGYERGDVEYKFIKRVADGTVISIGDLLRQMECEAGNDVHQQPAHGVTVRIPPHSSAKISIRSSCPSLFDDVPIGAAPVTKTRAWRFEPNEATIETEHGPAEVEYLDVEFRVIQRVYPSQVGRLLAYEDQEKRIANIDERHLSLGRRSIRLLISGEGRSQPAATGDDSDSA